eukprot:2799272-Rhodomonas_salina.1
MRRSIRRGPARRGLLLHKLALGTSGAGSLFDSHPLTYPTPRPPFRSCPAPAFLLFSPAFALSRSRCVSRYLLPSTTLFLGFSCKKKKSCYEKDGEISWPTFWAMSAAAAAYVPLSSLGFTHEKKQLRLKHTRWSPTTARLPRKVKPAICLCALCQTPC